MAESVFSVGIITVSDRSFNGEREDKSADAISVFMRRHDYAVCEYALVPDEIEDIKKAIKTFADEKKLNLVLTTGGTGVALRDVTPEATMAIAERVVPGIAEAIRAHSLTKTKNAMLSRGVAVIRGGTLIINLPGSPKACMESLEAIAEALPHGLGLLRGEKLDL